MRSIKTYQRWRTGGNEDLPDKRPETETEPRNKLSIDERKKIIDICNLPDYVNLPPSQIVPSLADKGIYIASEATFYRVLNEHNQLARRGRACSPRKNNKPTTHIARNSNEVWSWDITYSPSITKGKFYYLYLIEDIYSRKIVGWEVHEKECGELASLLVERTILTEGCLFKPLVLHSDNGSPMKSSTLLAKLEELGVTPSRGRPSVSNDNPYSESLFKTMKYNHAKWPENGFKDMQEARAWVSNFVQWYNHEHKHSKIKFIAPAQRHNNEDLEILNNRRKVYLQARANTPERWSGDIRNWQQVTEVYLNPAKNQHDN